MESFAVRCPVPEVFEMLRTLALKAGYTGNTTRVSDWFYIGTSGCIECGEGHAVRGRGGSMLDEISIESAISELTKPRPKPLMVGSHRVTVNQDRSVTVGCTTVPAEVCDEIERRRKPKSLYRTLDKLLYRPRTDGGGNGWQVFDERQWINSINSINDHAALPTEEITEAEARQRFPEAFQEAK